jgi:hypothetical protein
VIVAATGYLIQCLFGSFIANEWGYWIVALLVRYSEIYKTPAAALSLAQEATPSLPSMPQPGVATG